MHWLNIYVGGCVEADRPAWLSFYCRTIALSWSAE